MHPNFLCLICRELNFQHRLDGDCDDILLGALSSILSKRNDCSFCSLICEAILQAGGEIHTTTHDGVPIICMLKSGFGGRSQISPDGIVKRERLLLISLEGHWEKQFVGWTLAARQLIGNEEQSDLFLGRRVREGEINFGTIEKWLRGCERWHVTADEFRGCGHRKWEDRVAKPDILRVIDVNLYRIIEAPRDCRYLALSYVWGGADTLQANTTNIGSLSLPNGLLDAAKVFPIGQTILDAITLTRSIHESYLWVDSLCILQDDAQEKHNQIASMDRVYCAAVCTIIAAGGDSANAGLAGVRPSSRSVKQIVKEVSPDISLVVPLSLQGFSLSSSTWNTRAWTYQERLMSKRFIIFTPNLVYWQCRTMLWYEDIFLEAEDVEDNEMMSFNDRLRFLNVDSDWSLNRPANDSNIRLLNHPSLNQYKWLVGEYTRRELSYPGDIINAFAGIQRVVGTGLKSDFLFGLPSKYLDASLLWKPSGSIQRRVENADTANSSEIFPSWSWVGWVGEVEYPPLYPESGRNEEEHSRPLLHWYTWSSGTMSRVIQEWEIEYDQYTCPSPDAWSPLMLPHNLYQCPLSIPGPLILPDRLFFRTSTAEFMLGESNEEIARLRPSAPASELAVNVKNKDNSWAGIVHLHYPRTLDTKCDFLVLSEAQLVGLRSMDQVLRAKWDYFTFFNVLAVVWENNLARRIGVGRISKDAWGKSDALWRDIALC